MKYKKLLIILFATFYFLLSTFVSAQTETLNLDFLKGIVPCGTSYTGYRMCTICDFYKLIQNIINFILFVSAPLATLVAIYVAFLFFFSFGSQETIKKAKSNLKMLLWGIAWILGSWLVLNTILNVVANPSVFPKPWNQVQCSVTTSSLEPAASSETSGATSGPTSDKTTLNEQEARSRLQQAGISINKNPCPSGVAYQDVPGGCTSLGGVKTATIEAAIQLKKDCKCVLEITGGAELGHTEKGSGISHASGNKLDFNPNPALDKYIRDNANYIGKRENDGAQQYRAPDGTIYARESSHWDVVFVR